MRLFQFIFWTHAFISDCEFRRDFNIDDTIYDCCEIKINCKVSS